jgi:hypothetical protein
MLPLVVASVPRVTASEQAELQSDDFGSITGAVSVLRLSLPGRQTSSDVNLAALPNQALAIIREPSERHGAMPFRALLGFAVTIFESRLGCD